MGQLFTSRRVAVTVLCFVACQPAGTPALSVSVNPSTIDDRGQTTTVKVSAIDATGAAGKGEVRIYSLGGSLAAGETWSLDSTGTTATGFACDVSIDSQCLNRVRIIAEWKTGGATVSADTRVNITTTSGTGGGGGGGGFSDVFGYSMFCSTSVMPDEVSLKGTVGGSRAVDFRITRGNSAGRVIDDQGGQMFTSGTVSGLTRDVEEVNLWLWPAATPLTTNVIYNETNAGAFGLGGQEHFIDFSLDFPDASYGCGIGDGQGSVVFRSLGTVTSGSTSGAVFFDCPDAGISVKACFAYR